MISIAQMRALLEWFAGRAGDHIPNESYQYLFVEFANMLAEMAMLEKKFDTTEDVTNWVYSTSRGDAENAEE